MKMKALVGLLFLVFAISVSSNSITTTVTESTSTPVLKLVQGKTYIYSYNGRLVSGVAQDQSKVALWDIESDIVLQAEQQQQLGSHVAMQMMNVRVGRTQGSATSGKLFSNKVTLDHRSIEEYEEQLSKPIRFYWDQGKIKNFEADQNEPQWSINIKKAILSLFNVDFKKVHEKQQTTYKVNDIFGRKSYYEHDSPVENKFSSYKTYEDGVNGICETFYQVISAVDDRFETLDVSSEKTTVYNVTKTRNYEKCLTGRVGVVEKSNTDLRGSPSMVCDEFDYQTGICIKQRNVQIDQQTASEQQKSYIDSPVDLFNYVKYNITVINEKVSTTANAISERVAQIDSIYGQGKTVFETNGKQLLMVSEQNITLIEKMPTSAMGAIKQIRNIMLHQELAYRLPSNTAAQKLDIPYYSLFGEIDHDELKDKLIPSLLQSVVRDIEIANEIQEPSKNTMEKIVQLSDAFAVMSSKHLEEIFDKVASKGQSNSATTHQQLKRKLYLDLLSSSGTTEAALLADKLYRQDRITTSEAKEVFETIPQNLFQVDQKVVDAYISMLLSDKVQNQRHLAASVGIALGKMINQATEALKTRHQRRSTANAFVASTLDEKQIEQVLNILEKALRTCNTFHQKVALIETLAHTGHSQGLSILSSIVKDTISPDEIPGYPIENVEDLSQERNFVRQVAIYSLTHLVRTNGPQVRDLVLPVYQNRLEPYEVRIAAFTVLLINGPGRETLERIASELHTEQNRQVVSFVVSSLETVSKFDKEPASRKLASDAKFALGMAPKTESLGWQYSKMYGFSHYDTNSKQGVNLITEWVSSNVSQIPRSGYLAVRQSDNYNSNLALELGYNVKGINQFLKRITESNILIPSLAESLLMADSINESTERLLKKRSVEHASAKQTLQALKEKLDLNVRGEEELKATIFFKLFERTSYYSFDRQFVEQILDESSKSIKEIVSQLKQGQDYHYVKLVMPKQLYKVVSSEMGLPVVITERHPMILSIKFNQAKLQMVDQINAKTSTYDTKTTTSTMPLAINFTVQVEPALYQTTYNFIFGLTPVTTEAIGTVIEKTTRVSIPFDLSVGFVFNPNTNSQSKHQQQFSFSITPRMPQEIFHYHQETKTFVTSAKIVGPPERRWLQDASVIKHHSLPFKYEKEYFKKELGLGLKFKMTSDSGCFYTNEKSTKYSSTSKSILTKLEDICVMILSPIFGTQISNKQETSKAIHLTLETDEEQPATGYDFSIRYKKFDLIENEEDEGNNVDEELFYSSKTASDAFSSRSSKSSIKRIVRDMVENWKKDQKIWKEIKGDSSNNLVAHSLQMVAKATSGSRHYLLQALQAQTYDSKTYWTSVRATTSTDILNSGESGNKQVCFDSVVAYQQKSPSEFYYEPIATQNLQCRMKARLDFGQDCQQKSTESAHVQLEGVMETAQASEEEILKQRDLEAASSTTGLASNQNKAIKQEWFYQQCAEDRASGKSSSYACKRSILEDSYFKRLTMDINYENVPETVKNLTKKLALVAKVAFYQNLDVIEYDHEEKEANKMHVKAQYSTKFSDIPMMDVSIETPKEKMIFEKVDTSFVRPVSALYSTVQVHKNMLNGYQSEDSCVMMEDYLQTFDNVSLELPQSKCQYLLAKDCSSYEKFAIFVRQLDSETKTKEVTILIDGREIVMTPSSVSSTSSVTSTAATIKIDGEHVELSQGQVRIMSEGQMTIVAKQTIVTSASEQIIELEHEQHQLVVKYDGKNVQVQVGTQYRGAMCGICGDNNHESINEFSGPDECLYEREEDFINSYALTGSHCTQVPVFIGGKKCPKQESIVKKFVPKEQLPISRLYEEWNQVQKASRVRQIQYQSDVEEVARAAQRHLEKVKARQAQLQEQQKQIEASKIQNHEQQVQDHKHKLVKRLHTMAIRQNDKFCFSLQPVLSCIEGVSRPVQVTTQNFSFHCLPSQSIAAQTLVEKSRYQILEIFGKKQVDLVAPLQVPVDCYAI